MDELRERFYAQTKRVGDCLEWIGCRNNAQYGMWMVNGRRQVANRWVWEIERGPVPRHLFVCHHCDNPPCVDIEHLFLGTQLDNMRDMVAKGRKTILRGTEHGRAILTEDDVRAIRASKEAAWRLAEKYGVGKGTIYRARNGESWRHLK